jgi:hypothetical protein
MTFVYSCASKKDMLSVSWTMCITGNVSSAIVHLVKRCIPFGDSAFWGGNIFSKRKFEKLITRNNTFSSLPGQNWKIKIKIFRIIREFWTIKFKSTQSGHHWNIDILLFILERKSPIASDPKHHCPYSNFKVNNVKIGNLRLDGTLLSENFPRNS